MEDAESIYSYFIKRTYLASGGKLLKEWLLFHAVNDVKLMRFIFTQHGGIDL